jgi:large subunit ribosomal protein L9
MEVILKETIDTLGLEGDIVNVKPGYARNYLIPQKKAEVVNKATLARLKQEQKAIAARRETEQRKAEQLAGKIEKTTVSLTRRVGDENRLFGSVGTKDLAEALAEKGIEIDRRSILLADPIKAIGEFVINVKVGYQMTSPLKVQVLPEGGTVSDKPVPAEPEEAAAEGESEHEEE